MSSSNDSGSDVGDDDVCENDGNDFAGVVGSGRVENVEGRIC